MEGRVLDGPGLELQHGDEVADPPRQGKRKRPKPQNADEELADRTLAYLNERRRELMPAATGFMPSPTNRAAILARIRQDNADEVVLRAVIDARVDEALERGPDWYSNVNPETPFRPRNWPRSIAIADALAQRRASPAFRTSSGSTITRAPATVDDEPMTVDEQSVWLAEVRRTGKIGDGHEAVRAHRLATPAEPAPAPDWSASA